MSVENKCKIEDISRCLVNEFRAEKICSDEILNLNRSISTIELDDNAIVYKISDSDFIDSLLSESEKSEIRIVMEHFNENIKDVVCSSYEYKISTGQLIIVILESEDGETLSSFIMEGMGEVLFKALSEFVGEDVEKNENPLGEVIDELNQFRPYGKYFR